MLIFETVRKWRCEHPSENKGGLKIPSSRLVLRQASTNNSEIDVHKFVFFKACSKFTNILITAEKYKYKENIQKYKENIREIVRFTDLISIGIV